MAVKVRSMDIRKPQHPRSHTSNPTIGLSSVRPNSIAIGDKSVHFREIIRLRLGDRMRLYFKSIECRSHAKLGTLYHDCNRFYGVSSCERPPQVLRLCQPSTGTAATNSTTPSSRRTQPVASTSGLGSEFATGSDPDGEFPTSRQSRASVQLGLDRSVAVGSSGTPPRPVTTN